MSAIRVLVSHLCFAFADSLDEPDSSLSMGEFLRITGKESPAHARDLFLAYSHLVDTIKRERAKMADALEPLEDQIRAAFYQQEVEEERDRVSRYLSSIARRGGRGIPAGNPGAGQSPASPEGTSMAHGCAAGMLTVGPVARAGQQAANAITADPLFPATEDQTSSGCGDPSKTQAA